MPGSAIKKSPEIPNDPNTDQSGVDWTSLGGTQYWKNPNADMNSPVSKKHSAVKKSKKKNVSQLKHAPKSEYVPTSEPLSTSKTRSSFTHPYSGKTFQSDSLKIVDGNQTFTVSSHPSISEFLPERAKQLFKRAISNKAGEYNKFKSYLEKLTELQHSNKVNVHEIESIEQSKLLQYDSKYFHYVDVNTSSEEWKETPSTGGNTLIEETLNSIGAAIPPASPPIKNLEKLGIRQYKNWRNSLSDLHWALLNTIQKFWQGTGWHGQGFFKKHLNSFLTNLLSGNYKQYKLPIVDIATPIERGMVWEAYNPAGGGTFGGGSIRAKEFHQFMSIFDVPAGSTIDLPPSGFTSSGMARKIIQPKLHKINSREISGKVLIRIHPKNNKLRGIIFDIPDSERDKIKPSGQSLPHLKSKLSKKADEVISANAHSVNAYDAADFYRTAASLIGESPNGNYTKLVQEYRGEKEIMAGGKYKLKNVTATRFHTNTGSLETINSVIADNSIQAIDSMLYSGSMLYIINLEETYDSE